jgi:hypothetical protein
MDKLREISVILIRNKTFLEEARILKYGNIIVGVQ